MKILVLNCGSSSIKYQFFNMAEQKVLAKGVAEKVGLKGSFIKHTKESGDKVQFDGEIIDHQVGIEYILGILTSKNHGCINELSEIDACGHRVAHGGEKFDKSEFINDFVESEIEKCIELAPLHNPANLKGILAMKALVPEVRQVATFDTAFHQTMPDEAFMYAIPYSLYKKYGIRRYGFHGTSHSYIAKEACKTLNVNIEDKKIITCHLGNGASMCAIKNGKSVDTSMGFTPLEGLVMGSRSGDLDIGVVQFIMNKEELLIDSLNTIFNKSSGLLGVSGISSDMREVIDSKDEGNDRCDLAVKMFTYRVKKYIGAYATAMGGVDMVIFAGGVGENSYKVRSWICEDLDFLGLKLDEEANKQFIGEKGIISEKDAKIACLVIPTDEELVIATDTQNIISKM